MPPIPVRPVPRPSLLLACLLASLAMASCRPQPAQEPAAAPEPEPVAHTLFDTRAMLFLEHPALVVGEPARFLAHLTVQADGGPVRSGQVSLIWAGSALPAAGATRDGLFIPEVTPTAAGTVPAALEVRSPQLDARFDLGLLTVHADRAAALAASRPGSEPAGAVPFLMEQQWAAGVRLTEAAPRTMAETLTVPASLRLAENAEALVTASLAGQLRSADDRPLPTSGESVAAGQLLGWIEPPLSAGDAAQLAALDAEWELAAFRLHRDRTAAEARRDFATGELGRLAELLPDGLATRRDVAGAERDLASAEADLAAARAGLETLDALRADGPREQTHRVALTAPMAGVVAWRQAVPGEAVEAGQALLRLIDPTRLWLEARLTAEELGRVDDGHRARARLTALGDRELVLDGRRHGRLRAATPELSPQSRTSILRYELLDPAPDLLPGLLAELDLTVGERRAEVTIPRQALVVTQGQPTVYVQLGGELFQRREVTVGLRDATHVEILDGLSPGERVASHAASSLRLADLSPDSAGHGHAH